MASLRNPSLFASLAALLVAVGLEDLTPVLHHTVDIVGGICAIIGIILALRQGSRESP
jgi:crotonobetainyl-CoA:carnitine CoA-transferase CaiB-like acyl-CoA transferase